MNVNSGATSGSVTLYDGPDTSHPEIALIAATAQIGLLYDAVLRTGLTALVAGTPDVTITVLPPPGQTP